MTSLVATTSASARTTFMHTHSARTNCISTQILGCLSIVICVLKNCQAKKELSCGETLSFYFEGFPNTNNWNVLYSNFAILELVQLASSSALFVYWSAETELFIIKLALQSIARGNGSSWGNNSYQALCFQTPVQTVF